MIASIFFRYNYTKLYLCFSFIISSLRSKYYNDELFILQKSHIFHTISVILINIVIRHKFDEIIKALHIMKMHTRINMICIATFYGAFYSIIKISIVE